MTCRDHRVTVVQLWLAPLRSRLFCCCLLVKYFVNWDLEDLQQNIFLSAWIECLSLYRCVSVFSAAGRLDITASKNRLIMELKTEISSLTSPSAVLTLLSFCNNFCIMSFFSYKGCRLILDTAQTWSQLLSHFLQRFKRSWTNSFRIVRFKQKFRLYVNFIFYFCNSNFITTFV